MIKKMKLNCYVMQNCSKFGKYLHKIVIVDVMMTTMMKICHNKCYHFVDVSFILTRLFNITDGITF